MNKIEQLINEYVDDFIKIISEEYNIRYVEIKNKWISFIKLDCYKNKEEITDRYDVKEKFKEIKDRHDVKEKVKEITDRYDVKEKEIKDRHDVKENIKTIESYEDEFVVRKRYQQSLCSGVIIRLNKIIKKYVHKDSGLVFYSKDELVVYAKFLDNKLCMLTDEDKDTCKRLKFRIDPSLYNEEDENYVYNDTNINNRIVISDDEW